MKKIIAVIIIGIVLMTSLVQAAPDPAAAGLLSAVFPGAGEWYNSNWQGSFPFGECIIGYICPLVQWSSIFDAVGGQNQEAIRIDFWTAPSN